MKVNIPIAQKSDRLNSQDLSFPVIQTLGVNDTRCVGCIQMEQGERLHVQLNQFSRFSPLVAPTFGDFKIKTHAFWIPTRLVWRHYLEFLDDSLDASFDDVKKPLNFSLHDIYDAFELGGLIVEEENWSATADGYAKKADGTPQYDVNIYNSINETGSSYNFSDFGRCVFSSLQALGYALPLYFCYDDTQSSSLLYKYYNDENYSLLPLLSFMRVFYDWIYPSQYVTQQGLGYFFLDDFVKDWYAGSVFNHAGYLLAMFPLLFNPYDKSFWTSLWAKPNQVAQSSQGGRGTSVIGDIKPTPLGLTGALQTTGSQNNSRVFSGNGGTAVGSFNSSSAQDYVTRMLSADAIRWLEKVSDFVLRSNVGGTRVREFLKSHFGFVPSDVQADVSSWIRTYTDRVLVQDVTNMSATSAVLGEQGGKAISSGNGSLKFEASERGMIIFVTQVVPMSAYYQGIDINCRAIKSRFDMYIPDFDSVSMEGVPRSALFAQYRDYQDWNKVSPASLGDVLGFAPRDAERKIKRAVLSGDFLFASRNTGLEAYHTYRDVLFGRSNLAIDARFLEADNQTQRIFAYTGEETESGLYAQYDKIFNEMYFNVTKFSHARSLSQSLPFFDEEGKKVSLEYEGANL